MRSLLLGVTSIGSGVLLSVLGYGVFPGVISTELIETWSVLSIESVPVVLFGFGVLFAFIGIKQKEPKFGMWLPLFLNAIPLGILLYILSE